MSCIINEKSQDVPHGINVETVTMFHLEDVITEYERMIFNQFSKKDFLACEKVLTDFCFELLDLSETEQVFIARTFFISIITDIIRVQTRKNQLHPRTLSRAYETIATIEKWKNITEYMLGIPAYMKQINNFLIPDTFRFANNIHVEKAVQLIHFHIKSDTLTVNWLARTLGISTTHLANTFKLITGDTITSYITKRKIDEICYQIKHSSKPIKEIRKIFGFKSDSYFIQYFKRAKGITPLQYKKDLI